MAKRIVVMSILEGYFNGLSFNNIARTRHARLGSSSKTESMLNRIFSGLCKVDCGDFNMREYLSSHKLVI